MAARVGRHDAEAARERREQLGVDPGAHAGGVGEDQQGTLPPLEGEDAPARHGDKLFCRPHAGSTWAASACQPSQTGSSLLKSS